MGDEAFNSGPPRRNPDLTRCVTPKRSIRLAALLLSGLMLSGCITTYRGYPRVMVKAATLSATGRSLFYTTTRNQGPLPHLYRGVGDPKTLQEVFERTGGFTHVSRLEPGLAADGAYYVDVYTTVIPESEASDTWGQTIIRLFPFGLILPHFSARGGYLVRYEFESDRGLRKTYRYKIVRKRGVWFVFLPFIWVNLFTPSAKGAFRSTAYAFVRDARADGLFPTP
jgi:hypothetical protein